ncbi:hypothetical protein AS850_02720 [Frondihabitans sp. 762G35]|nr:hypothetical protein AS850_02720 [Frondihabitans sp. 762G35]
MLITTLHPYTRATNPSRLRYFFPADPDMGLGGGGSNGGNDGAGGHGDGGTNDDGANGGGNDPGFPANTPVKDMTPEQQVAYHQNKARRLEDQLKGFDGRTPAQIKQLEQDLAAERQKSLSDADRAIEQAREEGRAELRTVLVGERVRTALERALVGRVPDAGALLDLDRSKFAKGTDVDTDAIKAWVDEHSTEQTGTQQRQNVDLGQGRNRGNNAPSRGVNAGQELFDSKKKTSNS